MAAVLTNGKGFYNPLVYILECHRLGIPLLPPSVNEPGPEFGVERNPKSEIRRPKEDRNPKSEGWRQETEDGRWETENLESETRWMVPPLPFRRGEGRGEGF